MHVESEGWSKLVLDCAREFDFQQSYLQRFFLYEPAQTRIHFVAYGDKKGPKHNCDTHTTHRCLETPAQLGTMPTHHMGRKAFLFVACLVSGWFPLVCSRALVRSSLNSVAPSDAVSNGQQYAHDFRFRDDHETVSANVNTTDTIYNDVLSFSSTKRVHRRAGKQPSPATDDVFTSSAAKGCSMLYMLAANADDALARLKANNPSLTSLPSSQSPWDNAGALKQYGWSDKKDSVNWAYMGINKVMEELAIDTSSDDNKNIQLIQDTAVTVDGKSYVVSEDICMVSLTLGFKLTRTSGIKGDLQPSHQRCRRPCDPLLHLLAS